MGTTPDRARPRLALGLFAVTLTITAITFVLHVTAGSTPEGDEWGLPGFEGILALATGFVGYLITRATSNPTGWIFSGLGVFSAVQYLAEQYATVGLTRASSLPAATTMAWVADWVWVAPTAVVGLLLLVFPDDRIESRAGRTILATGGLAAVAVLFTSAFMGPRVMTFDIANPYSINANQELHDAVFAVTSLAFMLALAAAAIRLVSRLRRATGIRRQQLKWFAYAAVVASVGLVFGAIPATSAVGSAFAVIGIVAIAAASAIAVLRYRLYDIDVVINRTIVYVTLTAVLGFAYVAMVFLLQIVLAPITADSGVAVAASTLAVAALFRPVRGRVQDFIDRRFYRTRYDARLLLDRLNRSLRDQVQLESVRAEVVGVVNDAVAPRHASLWLREGTRPR